MIVEFIGLPASGKSTIAKEFFKSEENVIYPLHNLYNKNWLIRNLYKLISVMFFIITNPIRTTKLSRLIFKSGQEKKFDYIRLTLNSLFIFKIVEKYTNFKNIILLDEGLMHHAWAIQMGATNHFDSEKYLNLCKFKSSKVIYVSCSSECVIKRMVIRGNLPIRHNKIKINIDKNRKIIEDLVSRMDPFSVLVLENSNQSDVQENVLMLKAFL